jgi:hypothetical protein
VPSSTIRHVDDQLRAEDDGHDPGDDRLGPLDAVGSRPRFDVAEHAADAAVNGISASERRTPSRPPAPRCGADAGADRVDDDRPRV